MYLTCLNGGFVGPPTKWTEWWNLLEFDGYRWWKTGQCSNLWYSEVQIKEQKWDSSHLTESKTKLKFPTAFLLFRFGRHKVVPKRKCILSFHILCLPTLGMQG